MSDDAAPDKVSTKVMLLEPLLPSATVGELTDKPYVGLSTCPMASDMAAVDVLEVGVTPAMTDCSVDRLVVSTNSVSVKYLAYSTWLAICWAVPPHVASPSLAPKLEKTLKMTLPRVNPAASAAVTSATASALAAAEAESPTTLFTSLTANSAFVRKFG